MIFELGPDAPCPPRMTHGDPKTWVAAPSPAAAARSHTHFLLPAPPFISSANSALYQPIAELRGPDGHRLKPLGSSEPANRLPAPRRYRVASGMALRPWPFVRRRYTRGGQKPPCSAWPRPSPNRQRTEGTPKPGGAAWLLRTEHRRQPQHSPDPRLLLSFFSSPPTSVLGIGTQDHG